MKIIFVNRFFFPDHSATSQLLTDLAFHLAGIGHNVHVVTSRQRYEASGASLPPVEMANGVKIHRIWTSQFGRSGLFGRTVDYVTFYLTAGWRLYCLARRDDIVVAKSDPPLISIVAALSAQLRGAKLVNWLQDLFPEIAVALRINWLFNVIGPTLKSLRNVSLKYARVNVVLGLRMQQRLIEQGVPLERLVVIPNWADGTAITSIGRSKNHLREEWGFGNHFVVGYSGNMGRVHEFSTILDAAEQLRNDSRIAFLFVGGGKWRAWIEAEAKRRSLSNVVLKPYQPREQLALTLGAADVHLISLKIELEGFVVPSKFYGIAAAGRPTIFIGDPDGEIARIVRETQCGVAVKPCDAAGLVSAITQFKDDLALRQRYGDNARRIFESKFDKPIALAAWKVILEI